MSFQDVVHDCCVVTFQKNLITPKCETVSKTQQKCNNIFFYKST